MRIWSEMELREALTSRQYEVLELVAQGLSSKDIARQLGLSHKTIDNHVAEILARLSVPSRSDAARLFHLRTEHREKSPRVAEALDEPSISPAFVIQPRAAEPEAVTVQVREAIKPTGMLAMLFSIFALPPVGGRRHGMGLQQRASAIGQVMLVVMAIVAAIVSIIVGVLHLLGR